MSKPIDAPMPEKPSNWGNKVTMRFAVSLMRDSDIVVRLAQEDNVSGYIRNALRYYIDHEDEILEAEKKAMPIH